MSPDESRGRPRHLDPEAEQEVDFGRYGRLLAARWWLLAAGLVLGAIVGYAVSLGGSQTFQATATLYLGQPYSASGNIALQTLQTNPSTVKTIIHAASVIDAVAASCKAKPASFRGGISTQSVSGNLAKNGQTPLVSITVKSAKRKTSACAANGLAHQVLDRIAAYANQKIAYDSRQVTADERAINAIQQQLAGSADELDGQAPAPAPAAQLPGTTSARVSQLLLQARAGRGAEAADGRGARARHRAQPPEQRRRRGPDRADPRRDRGADVGRRRRRPLAAPPG